MIDLELDVLKGEEWVSRRRGSTAVREVIICHGDIGELGNISGYCNIPDEIPGDVKISKGDGEEIEVSGYVSGKHVDNHIGISALGGSDKDGAEGEGIERGRIVDVGGEFGGLIEEDIEVVGGVADVGDGDHIGDEGGIG